MKLKKCYISSFGKICDFSIDFNDKINTFMYENGWGKSTIAGFIKCMFYGLSHDKTRTVDENERLRYKPWNSTEKFGGYIIFEKNGSEYKVERYFGNKESEDTFLFTDTNTGKDYSSIKDIVERFGQSVFDIDCDGFMSTTFFSQREFEIKSNSSLTSKFNELYQSNGDENYDVALKRLQDKAKEYVKVGSKGLIPETKNEIISIDEQIKRAEENSHFVKEKREKCESLKKYFDIFEKQRIDLENKKDKASRVETLKIQKQQYDDAVNKKQSFLKELIEPQKILNEQLENAKEIYEISNVVAEYYSDCRHKENLINDLKVIPKQENKPQKSALSVLFTLPIILLVVSIVLTFIGKPIFALLGFVFTVAVFVAILFVVIKSKNKALLSDKTANLYDKVVNDIENINDKICKTEEALNNYFAHFNLDEILNYNEKVNVVKTALEIFNSNNKQIASLEIDIDRLSKEKNIFANFDGIEDVDVLNNQIKDIVEKSRKISSDLSEISSSIKYYEDEADKLLDLESKRNELCENLSFYQKDYEIIIKTISAFEKANDNLKTKYRKPLEDSLNKYLSLIEGGNMKATIDIDLNVKVIETKGEMVVDYYSKGYQNLIEICKRFALTDVLYKKDKPFIILDDPFYNLDENKTIMALKLIDKLKEEYQIIYFVCHQSRCV